MDSPDRQQVRDVAAADVDDVLGEHEGFEVADGSVEQLNVGRATVVLSEGGVETFDVLGGVSAGGRDEADLRRGLASAGEHEAVKQRVVRLHREAAPAERDDLAQGQAASLPGDLAVTSAFTTCSTCSMAPSR